MKTIFLSTLLAVSLIASASGTKEKSIASYQTIQNFIVEFGNIDNVKWSNSLNNMTKADFILDDEPVCAYFDEEGAFVAVTREAGIKELPKKLKAAVEEKQPGAKILTVFEMTSKQEKSWFIETELNNEKKVWKGSELGFLTRYFVGR